MVQQLNYSIFIILLNINKAKYAIQKDIIKTIKYLLIVFIIKFIFSDIIIINIIY